jgi:hypothetical protein
MANPLPRRPARAWLLSMFMPVALDDVRAAADNMVSVR